MKRNSRQTRKQKQSFEEEKPLDIKPISYKPAIEPLKAKTANQQKYIDAIRSAKITFGIGPAGTGKTFIAGAVAVEMLLNNEIEQIIITRPAVEAGEDLGALPGEKEEKYEPYIAAFRDVLNQRLGKGHVDYLLKTGKLVGEPFAYMRGKTFRNAVVILDEAQNATKSQMKLFLTRIGENCKVIVDGDSSQADIHNSGLDDAIARLAYIPAIKIVKFTQDDIVRSSIVSEIVQAYSADHFIKT